MLFMDQEYDQHRPKGQHQRRLTWEQVEELLTSNRVRFYSNVPWQYQPSREELFRRTLK